MVDSVAPMMEWTDNHFRTLARIISKHAWLYTEMVVAETIVHQQDNLVNNIYILFSGHFLKIPAFNSDNFYHHYGTGPICYLKYSW